MCKPGVLKIAALLVAGASLLFGGEHARDIVRRSIETNLQAIKLAESYTFIQREERRELDAKGRIKRRTLQTYDVTLTEGSPYLRLIERDDKPLPPEEDARERKKLEKSIADRRAETPSQREKRVAEWRTKREREWEFLREVPDAFDFCLLGEEPLEGRPTYVIEATPLPGYRPKTGTGRVLPKMKGKLWIDVQDYQWVKMEADVIDTVSIGGILARVYQGTRLSLDQTRVNGEIWLPRHMSLTATGRLFLFKRFATEIEVTFRDYRKFQSDSRVVSVEEQN